MAISATLIKSIQDILRQDAGVDGDAQRLSRLRWLLFLKIFDDQETEFELMHDRYRSPISASTNRCAMNFPPWQTGARGDLLGRPTPR